MRSPLNKIYDLNDIPVQGRFGGIRKYDRHTGVDLYCAEGDPVYAFEDGKVLRICNFTGEIAGSPWWNDTKAVLIEGNSGVLLYGEMKPIELGEEVKKGDLIGHVVRVLKKDKGLPTCMLHMECYEHGYQGEGEWWRLNEEKPIMLKNIEEVLWI